MKFNIRESHICEQGLVRKENQDSFFQYVGADIGVFCVADGMGGHENGKRASDSIVNGVREWVDEFYIEKYHGGFLEILDDFEKKLDSVNQQLFRFYNNGQICGSTLAALILFGEYYAVFSMGDSRVYQKRGLSFSQLTKDDTWENSDQIPAGLLPENIKRHNNYGKLIRAVGTQEAFIPNRTTGRLKARDVFLLCSDGIYKHCDTKTMMRVCGRRLIESEDALDDKLWLLRAEVYSRGASDNLTAILVSVG